MSSTRRSDVLVIGGGLMGTATAFFLRREHGLSVTLLEREMIGRQASGTNFGNVRRQQVWTGRQCLAKLHKDRPQILEGTANTDGAWHLLDTQPMPRQQVQHKTKRPEQMRGENNLIQAVPYQNAVNMQQA